MLRIRLPFSKIVCRAIAGAAAFARDLVAIAPSLIARKGQSVDHGFKLGTGRRAEQARPSSNIG